MRIQLWVERKLLHWEQTRRCKDTGHAGGRHAGRVQDACRMRSTRRSGERRNKKRGIPALPAALYLTVSASVVVCVMAVMPLLDCAAMVML